MSHQPPPSSFQQQQNNAYVAPMQNPSQQQMKLNGNQMMAPNSQQQQQQFNGYPQNDIKPPVIQSGQQQQQIQQNQAINYSNFQTKAIQQPLTSSGGLSSPLLNGNNNNNSALSSRTSSPGIQSIPQSQLPPSKSWQQMPTTTPLLPPSSQYLSKNSSSTINNVINNNINQTFGNNSMLQQQQPPQQSSAITSMTNLSGSLKNLDINNTKSINGVHQYSTSMSSSKSAQNLINNNIINNTNTNTNNINNNNTITNVSSYPSMLSQQPLQQQQQQHPGMNVNSNMSQRIPLNHQQSNLPPPMTTTITGNMNIQSSQLPPTIGMQNNTQQLINKRPMYPTGQSAAYPQQQQQQMNYQNQQQQQQQPMSGFTGTENQVSRGNLQYQTQQQQPMGVVQGGFNRLWGNETVDLMQQRHILPPVKVQPPTIKLNHQFQEAVNCSPDIFRCTLTKIPESNALLKVSRLPLGILIHPYRDLSNLPVISCTSIVRCRVCRTYINPFVFFVDSKKWKCNLCYRVNELPEEFQYDPVSKTYGDPTRRPEIKCSTIEFIAPSEYMLRPPQPAVYLFLLDVSSLAQQSGYLDIACNMLSEQLDNLPGDARTQIGVIAYNSAIHFYNIAEGFNQPHEITVLDVDDIFLPYPDNLLVNLKECRELINDLLIQIPKRFATTHDTKSALGAALQAAFKLMGGTGGRVTVFQTCLPNYGPGALQSREDPNNRSAKDVQHLGPATDFYKRLALECSGQQIAVDLFLLNSQYSDLATLSGISKFSGGCIYHIPLFNSNNIQHTNELKKQMERYLTRKIGFESVMRVRCTRGLSIHTFHGNFFVRSTDLLSLPNVNPDSGYGMQISFEESLSDVKTVCFQAALLYTSSKAERRIRVHTMCLPVTDSLSDVINSADTQCIVGLLSKMAVDRSLISNLSDARDAFINATVDALSAFRLAQNLPSGASGLVAPLSLSLLPLYTLALLKQMAFRTGTSTRLDDRVHAMNLMKTLPLDQLIRYIYPDFYLLDSLFTEDDDKISPPKLQLSAEKLDSRSMFLMDTNFRMYLYVGSNVNPSIIKNVLGKNSITEIPDQWFELPKLETPSNEALHNFITTLNEDKPVIPSLQIIRDSSPCRSLIVQNLVDDRNENSLSYYEFLQHLRTQIK